MYTAFVGAAAPDQDGMRRALFPISNAALKGFFRLRVLRAPGSTVVPSHCSPADLAGKHILSSSWAADVGIAEAISKSGLSQASSAGQDRCPIGFACGEHGPGHARQLIGQRRAGDVVVGTCCKLCQPCAQAGRLLLSKLQDGACALYKQPSQVGAPALANAEQLLLASG